MVQNTIPSKFEANQRGAFYFLLCLLVEEEVDVLEMSEDAVFVSGLERLRGSEGGGEGRIESGHVGADLE